MDPAPPRPHPGAYASVQVSPSSATAGPAVPEAVPIPCLARPLPARVST